MVYPKQSFISILEGTLEPELKLHLAQKNNIDIGQHTIEEVKAPYQFDSPPDIIFKSLLPCHECSAAYRRFLYPGIDYLKKAKEHNIKYAELFFDPQAHTSRGVPIEAVINGYYEATQQAREFGVEANLIMCFCVTCQQNQRWKLIFAALP